MACTITISSATGTVSPAGTLSQIVVSGLASNCSQVDVSITCPPSPAQTMTVPVSGGSWSATFTNLPPTCKCTGSITIRVTCSDHMESCSALTTLQIDCPPPAAECPQFTAINWLIGDCQADGSSPVTFTCGLFATGTYTAELQANGSTIAIVSGPGATTLTGSGNFTGSVTFVVVITNPTGCTSLPPITVTLPTCPKCPDVTLGFTYSMDCDANGNRSVTVTASVVATSPTTAELLNPAGAVVDSVSGTGTLNMTDTATYPAGSTQLYTVQIISQGNCGIDQLSIQLPACAQTSGGNGDGTPFCPCCIALILVVIAYYLTWAFGFYTGDLVVPVIQVNLGSALGWASVVFALLVWLVVKCYMTVESCKKCWECRFFRCMIVALISSIILILLLLVVSLIIGGAPLVPQWLPAVIAAALALAVFGVLVSSKRCKKFFATGNCN